MSISRRIAIILIASCVAGGCATTEKSLLLGIVSGGVAGAAGGHAAGSKDAKKAAMTGAVIGSVLGGVAAYATHKGLEKRDDEVRRDTLLNLEKYEIRGSRSGWSQGEGSPGSHEITRPVVEGEYVEEHITSDGKRLIEGHRTWIIRENSKWVPKGPSPRERRDDGK